MPRDGYSANRWNQIWQVIWSLCRLLTILAFVCEHDTSVLILGAVTGLTSPHLINVATTQAPGASIEMPTSYNAKVGECA